MVRKLIKETDRKYWAALLILFGLFLLSIMAPAADDPVTLALILFWPIIIIIMGLAVYLYRPSIETFKEQTL